MHLSNFDGILDQLRNGIFRRFSPIDPFQIELLEETKKLFLPKIQFLALQWCLKTCTLQWAGSEWIMLCVLSITGHSLLDAHHYHRWKTSTQWAPSIKNAEDSSSESRSAESSEITRNNRTALNLFPPKPARSLQKKKYGDAFENGFRTRLGVLMKIHSRFIARPLNRFTHVESIQPGFQVLSNGHESIQRTRFNGFKFNRRRPVDEFALSFIAPLRRLKNMYIRCLVPLLCEQKSFVINLTLFSKKLGCW